MGDSSGFSCYLEIAMKVILTGDSDIGNGTGAGGSSGSSSGDDGGVSRILRGGGETWEVIQQRLQQRLSTLNRK